VAEGEELTSHPRNLFLENAKPFSKLSLTVTSLRSAILWDWVPTCLFPTIILGVATVFQGQRMGGISLKSHRPGGIFE
jgi:hypothetical protein